MITDYGKSRVALWLGGSDSTYPTYFVIGSINSTVTASDTALQYIEDKQLITSTDVSTTKKVKFIGDWNSIEMSGLSLAEFGMTTSGAGLTGSIWSRISFPAINFDGTNELRIEELWEVY